MTITLDGTSGINTPGVVNTAAQTVATTLAVTGVSTLTGGFTVGATAAPAFSAYLASNQNLTASTFTKVTINTEDFDTNSNFDSTTNYRFTPTVAGYYQVNLSANFNSSATNPTNDITLLYKNGAEIKRVQGTSATSAYGNTLSSLVYMNGSTDYLEMYVWFLGGTGTIYVASGSNYTWFQASMVRSA